MTRQEAKQILIHYGLGDNNITCGMIADAINIASDALSNNIPFKYKELEEASHDKRFESVRESVAFRLGVMWVIRKIYPDKTPTEIFNEIEAPTINYD